MGKFDGFLICSDCDGTLTNDNQEISTDNSRAIKYFQDNGGLFTVATGRFSKYINKYKDIFTPNTYVIALNGTMIYDLDNDKVIYSNYLNKETVNVLDYIDKRIGYSEEIHICTDDNSFCYTKQDNDSFKEVYKNYIQSCHKIIFCQKEENTIALKNELIKQFGSLYNFSMSWPRGLEMHSKESGKGECVLLLKKLLKREIHTTICVGDYENDISMIDVADIGYAVKNASDKLKESADRITVTNNEHAIAKIIYELK